MGWEGHHQEIQCNHACYTAGSSLPRGPALARRLSFEDWAGPSRRRSCQSYGSGKFPREITGALRGPGLPGPRPRGRIWRYLVCGLYRDGGGGVDFRTGRPY